jgi:hypothetical protein
MNHDAKTMNGAMGGMSGRIGMIAVLVVAASGVATLLLRMPAEE